MTWDEFELLKRDDMRTLIEQHRADDPVKLALRLKINALEKQLLCTQIKYRQRAAVKLPSYATVGCILPPRAYEQSSSEQAAAALVERGADCLDLSAGLGVDTRQLAMGFDRVIAVERDRVLAAVTQWNLDRMGVRNVTVVNDSAEHFLTQYSGEPFDLIYIDPDRRDSEGNRQVLLSDSSPDVTQLMPQLLQLARRVIVKCSPMLDTEAARNAFPGASVEVVSVDGECKALLIRVGEESSSCVRATALRHGERVTFATVPKPWQMLALEFTPRYLWVPDVALLKAGIAGDYAAQFGVRTYASSPSGYLLAETCVVGFCGQIYRIEEVRAYHPAKLKADLKKRGIRRIMLLRREFRYGSSEILRALQVREGEQEIWYFTTLEGELTAMRVTKTG